MVDQRRRHELRTYVLNHPSNALNNLEVTPTFADAGTQTDMDAEAPGSLAILDASKVRVACMREGLPANMSVELEGEHCLEAPSQAVVHPIGCAPGTAHEGPAERAGNQTRLNYNGSVYHMYSLGLNDINNSI